MATIKRRKLDISTIKTSDSDTDYIIESPEAEDENIWDNSCLSLSRSYNRSIRKTSLKITRKILPLSTNTSTNQNTSENLFPVEKFEKSHLEGNHQQIADGEENISPLNETNKCLYNIENFTETDEIVESCSPQNEIVNSVSKPFLSSSLSQNNKSLEQQKRRRRHKINKFEKEFYAIIDEYKHESVFWKNDTAKSSSKSCTEGIIKNIHKYYGTNSLEIQSINNSSNVDEHFIVFISSDLLNNNKLSLGCKIRFSLDDEFMYKKINDTTSVYTSINKIMNMDLNCDEILEKF